MAQGMDNPVSAEPGYRYRPRRPESRVFDVSRGRRAASPDQPLAPPVASEPIPSPYDSSSAPKSASTISATKTHVPIADANSMRDVRRSAHHKSTTRPAAPRQRKSIVLRRQMVDRANQYTQRAKAQRIRFVMAFTFGGIVASLVLVSVLGLYMKLRGPEVLAERTSAAMATQSPATVSEAPVSPEDIAAYSVVEGTPRLLRIPKLNIQARIYPVKTNYANEPLAAPNINDVGWLSEGVVPGSTGAALLNGSVASPTKNGVFATLSALGVGDEIIVEMGEGVSHTFKVVSSQLYNADAVDMKKATSSAIAGKPGLNLLTDIGRFNVRSNAFEQRRVVFAVLQ